MPRRRREPPAGESHRLDPLNVYNLAQATALLGLRGESRAGEIRAGRLRVAKRVKRYFFLGEWLIEWIRAGELKCRPRPRPDVPEPDAGRQPDPAAAERE